MKNLLSRMIQEEKSEELLHLDAINIVDSLFAELLDREKDILTRRFGLQGEKGETLEKIGGSHKLTRERVRQIEAASIKKIKKLEKLENYISTLMKTIQDLLDEHGGLIRRDYLLDILTVLSLEINNKVGYKDPGYEQNRQKYRNHFSFIISQLLADRLETINNNGKFTPSVKMKDQAVDYLEELADDLLAKVDESQKTLNTSDLINFFKESEVYNKYREKLERQESADISPVFKSKVFVDKADIINRDKIIYSLMQLIKNLERNKYGDWGIANWHEVKPKTVNDKIYLVLKHEGQPLHFTTIAEKINKKRFDNKKANAATVHNELILDDRYVLMSRGTYGLKEWQK